MQWPVVRPFCWQMKNEVDQKRKHKPIMTISESEEELPKFKDLQDFRTGTARALVRLVVIGPGRERAEEYVRIRGIVGDDIYIDGLEASFSRTTGMCKANFMPGTLARLEDVVPKDRLDFLSRLREGSPVHFVWFDTTMVGLKVTRVRIEKVDAGKVYIEDFEEPFSHETGECLLTQGSGSDLKLFLRPVDDPAFPVNKDSKTRKLSERHRSRSPQKWRA